MAEPGLAALTALRGCSLFAFLKSFDRFGIVVRKHADPQAEDADRFFVSWGAVLDINGPA